MLETADLFCPKDLSYLFAPNIFIPNEDNSTGILACIIPKGVLVQDIVPFTTSSFGYQQVQYMWVWMANLWCRSYCGYTLVFKHFKYTDQFLYFKGVISPKTLYSNFFLLNGFNLNPVITFSVSSCIKFLKLDERKTISFEADFLNLFTIYEFFLLS